MMSEHLKSGLLDAYIEKALEPNERVLIEQHLAGCPDCRKRLAEHRRLMILAAHLPLEPIPANLVSKVQARLAQLKAIRWKELQQRRLGWVSLGFAAIGLLLLGSAWQQVVRILTVLLNQLDNNLLTSVWQNLVNLLAENWPELAQTELNWQAQLAKDLDAVLLGGAIFLSLAAFAAMARVLLAAQNNFIISNEE
jgi:predicted anti-sigma-YlaC factor YlaD